MAEYTPTTEQVREEYSITVIDGTVLPSRAKAFDRWFAEEIEAATHKGYVEALRNAAYQAENYRDHPAGAAATLAVAFNLAVEMSEKED